MPKRARRKISQGDLKEQAEFQLDCYRAQERSAVNGLLIQQRFNDGAEVEEGFYEWNPQDRMARRR